MRQLENFMSIKDFNSSANVFEFCLQNSKDKNKKIEDVCEIGVLVHIEVYWQNKITKLGDKNVEKQ